LSKKEVWKDVVGYEGLYQVSNLGRVRSLERIGVFKNKQDAYKVFYQKYIELRGVPPWDLKIFKTH